MMSRTLAIASAVISDAVRRKVMWVVLFFAGVLALAVPSLPSYGQGVVGAVFREVVIALMYTASLVVALVLAATRVPAEVERRTVFNVLSRDVDRWQYLLGTWLGMFAVVGISIIAFSAIAVVVGYFQYSQVMLRLLEASFAVWLEMGVIMAFTVMLSTRFSPVTSIVGALVGIFVGHSISTLMNLPPDQTLPVYIPSLEVFDVINPVAHGSGYGVTYAGILLVSFLAWTGLLLLGATALFERRDL